MKFGICLVATLVYFLLSRAFVSYCFLNDEYDNPSDSEESGALRSPCLQSSATMSSHQNCSSDQADADCLVRRVQTCSGIRLGTLRYHIGDGFYFHRQRLCGGRMYLRCVGFRSSPPCTVRAVMNQDGSNFRVTTGLHNHGPDNLFERVLQLRNSLLEACRARPNVRLDVIYHDVCRSVQREVSSRVSLLSIRPSMIRAQSENRPNIPHTFSELSEILLRSQELSWTLDGAMELYQGMVGNEGHRSLIFMSRRILDGVVNSRHIFCDATFFARPNTPASSQLFTVVTVRDNHVIPVCHALMESRSSEAYRNLLLFFRNFAPNLNPDFIMTDFEQAEQIGLTDAYPLARLSGCLWHYARAVCRNVRSLGLQNLVRENENARRIVRLCLGIPLAPPGRLQEALNCIVIESRRLQLHGYFNDFFHYIRTTWIIGVGDELLSVFGVRHRTNNVAECHHRNLNSRLVQRPNIWRFLDIMREAEDIAWRDLGRLELGLAPSRSRRVSSVLNDARIRSCSRQIMNREIDMLHFLASVSWHLDSTMREGLLERPDEGRPPSPVRGPPPDGAIASIVPSPVIISRTGRQSSLHIQGVPTQQRELHTRGSISSSQLGLLSTSVSSAPSADPPPQSQNFENANSIDPPPQSQNFENANSIDPPPQSQNFENANSIDPPPQSQNFENANSIDPPPQSQNSANANAIDPLNLSPASRRQLCASAALRRLCPTSGMETGDGNAEEIRCSLPATAVPSVELSSSCLSDPSRNLESDSLLHQNMRHPLQLSPLPGSNSQRPRRHQFDPDFEAEFSGLQSCMEVDMLQRPPNVLSSVERQINSSSLFDELMEEYLVDDPLPVPQSSRRSARRQSSRGGRGRVRRGGRQARRNSSDSTSHSSGQGATVARRGRQSRRNTNDTTFHLSDQSATDAQSSPLGNEFRSGQEISSDLRRDLRRDEFSDEEVLGQEIPAAVRRWQECVICYLHVGRYTVLPCGAFPVCGSCIRRWFINLRNPNCLHCGGPAHGWLRLNVF